MPNLTLIIILSAVIPIVLVVVIVGGLMRSQQQTDQLLSTGIPARGRILQLGTTGGSVAVMGHRHLKLILTVEVHPAMGAPYMANFTQLISELQLPSVQPGAYVELRVDPKNPARVALASVGGPPPGMPPQGHGQGWGGAPQQPMGFAPQPVQMGVAQPNYKSALPFIAFMMFITTVPTAAILLYVFGGFGNWFGASQSSDGAREEEEEEDEPAAEKKSKKSGGTCAKAAQCCKVVSQGAASSACENWERAGSNEAACTQALDGYKQAAKSLKKSCD